MPEDSTTPDHAERFARVVEALNARDFDLVESLHAPDALYHLRAEGSLEGREAIRKFFEDWVGVYEEFVYESEELRELGNGVGFSVLRQRGRLVDTAAWIHDRFAFVFTLADGLIGTVTSFTDIDEARAAAERLAKERG